MSPRHAQQATPKIEARVLPELAAQGQPKEEEEARKPNFWQMLLNTQARVLREIQMQLHSKGNHPTPTMEFAWNRIWQKFYKQPFLKAPVFLNRKTKVHKLLQASPEKQRRAVWILLCSLHSLSR